MIRDYMEIRASEGMPKMVDAALASAFLLNAKNGVRNCAIALTEAASPRVRSVLITELNNAIDLHTEISNMMIEKRWFHPENLEKQFQMDAESSNMAVKIGKMDLFPGNTNRLGTFATPEK